MGCFVVARFVLTKWAKHAINKMQLDQEKQHSIDQWTDLDYGANATNKHTDCIVSIVQ